MREGEKMCPYQIKWTKTGAVSHVINKFTKCKFIISTARNPYNIWETCVFKKKLLIPIFFLPLMTKPVLILNATTWEMAEKLHHKAMSDFQNEEISKLAKTYRHAGSLPGGQLIYFESDD
jgi:hypothetical protein